MPQSKTKSRSSRRKARYDMFPSGEFLTLVSDPQNCYVVGLSLNKGQVVDTLLDHNWASGTRFKTEVNGKIIEYEVSGASMIKVNGKD